MPSRTASLSASPVLALIWGTLCLLNYFSWVSDGKVNAESLLWKTAAPIERWWKKPKASDNQPSEPTTRKIPQQSAWLKWLLGNPMCVFYCWAFAVLCQNGVLWMNKSILVRVDLLYDRDWKNRLHILAMLQLVVLIVSLWIVINAMLATSSEQILSKEIRYGTIPLGIILNGFLLRFVTSNLPSYPQGIRDNRGIRNIGDYD